MPATKFGKVIRLKGKTLSIDQFQKLVENLFENGFYYINGSQTTLADFFDYKAFHQIEEFEDIQGHKIIIEFVKEVVRGVPKYYIRDVELR